MREGAFQFSPSSPSLIASSESGPQTMELLQMMLLPARLVWPQTTELPQMIESSTSPGLQTMELPHTIELPQTTLLPQMMERLLVSLAWPVTGLKTAIGDGAPPLAKSAVPSAASTSR